jgi:insulysin
MRKMRIVVASVLLFTLSCSKNPLDVSEAKLKPISDKSEKKVITLKNKLQVLLISDESLKKSLVSLSVGVGSMEDPYGDVGTKSDKRTGKNKEGLAHFTEHMLFLGTKKYPEVGSYPLFFSVNQGMSNAYTSSENTNYQFQVSHDALDEGLDRFSQFFIAPLFTDLFIQREVNAVNNEHMKNLNSDMRRLYRVKSLMVPDNHPARKFSTGSLKTLKTINRDDVIEFYNKYYSSNNMKLVIMSKSSISDLEKMAKKYFSAIKNKEVKKPEYEFLGKREDMKGPQIVYVKSKTQQRKLSVVFYMPSSIKLWKTKPMQVLGRYIGDEGEGSLFSDLKKNDLAVSLSAGGYANGYSSKFSVSIDLTKKGRANIRTIVNKLFGYIRKLKETGYVKSYHEETKKLAKLSFLYQDLEFDMNYAAYFADLMFKYDNPIEAYNRESLIYEVSKKDYETFLNALTPDNSITYLLAPDVKTNKQEKHYGVEYAINDFSDSSPNAWGKDENSFALPVPNKYMPENLALKMDEYTNEPKKIIENEMGIMWFQQNKDIKLPKAIISLKLVTDKKLNSPRDELLKNFYLAALSENLNEWRYPIYEAGLNFKISSDYRSISIEVSGYSDKSMSLLKDFVNKIKTVELTKEKFDILVDLTKRSYKDFAIQPAYHQAFYYLKYLLSKNTLDRDEVHKVLADINREDVISYPSTLYKRIYIEGAAYGNLNSKDFKGIYKELFSVLGSEVLPESERLEPEDTELNPGHYYIAKKSKENNSAWIGYIQLGKRDAKLNAFMRVFSSLVNSDFYTDLRSKQQLGYIVNSDLQYNEKSYGHRFIIQSGNYPADELEKRGITWLKKTLQELKKVDDKKFHEVKTNIANEVMLPDKTMSEKMIWLMTEAYLLKGEFGFRKKLASILKDLNKDEFIKFLDEGFNSKNWKTLSIFVYPESKKKPSSEGSMIKNLKKFKSESQTIK